MCHYTLTDYITQRTAWIAKIVAGWLEEFVMKQFLETQIPFPSDSHAQSQNKGSCSYSGDETRRLKWRRFLLTTLTVFEKREIYRSFITVFPRHRYESPLSVVDSGLALVSPQH